MRKTFRFIWKMSNREHYFLRFILVNNKYLPKDDLKSHNDQMDRFKLSLFYIVLTENCVFFVFLFLETWFQS